MPRLSKRAQTNADWIREYLRVPEGKLGGRRIELSPAQLVWLQRIYGSTTRSFLLSIPRKNGKTTFAAFLLLLHLFRYGLLLRIGRGRLSRMRK